MKMNTFNEDVSQALARWKLAKNNMERLRSEINSADIEIRNSATALGKILIPPSPLIPKGEFFNIWVYGGLLRIREFRMGGYEIEIVEIVEK